MSQFEPLKRLYYKGIWGTITVPLPVPLLVSQVYKYIQMYL